MYETFDFGLLNSTEHMLNWLAPNPFSAIKENFEKTLIEQVPESVLLGLVVTSEPEWLTGAIPTKEDPSKAILVRVGLAFEFGLSVATPEGVRHELVGVFSWAGVQLNEPSTKAQQRTWFDLNGNLEKFGGRGELKQRIYFDLV